MTTTTHTLWARRQIRLVAVVNALTVVILLVAAQSVDEKTSGRSTVVWLSAGVVVVAVAAAADLSVLAVGRSAILHRRRRIIDDLPAPVPDAARGHSDDGSRVRVPGRERLHRPDCILITGKEIVPAMSTDVTTARHCEVCEP